MSRNHFKISKGVSLGPVLTRPSDPEDGDIIYNATSGKLERYENTAWKVMDASEVPNLITDGNANNIIASPFIPYNNGASSRPTTGTGGSPTVSTGLSSSVLYPTPLYGNRSIYIAKGAGNMQGNGWAIPFSADVGYRAKSLKVSFDYLNIASASITPGSLVSDGDIVVMLYDVTNAKLIEPSNIKLFSNSQTLGDKYEATFQTSDTGASYRLILHLASTNTASIGLKIDNISVKPQDYVYAPTITDWVPFTPTGSFTTNTTYAGRRRQVGDVKEYVYYISFTGAPNATTLSLNLPDTIDTTKLVSAEVGVTALDGSATYFDSAGATGSGKFLGAPYYASATTVGVSLMEDINASGNNDLRTTTQADPITFSSGDRIEVIVKVPILGLTSNTQVSDGYEARSLRVNALRSTNLTGLNPDNSSVKINITPNTVSDTYSGWNSSLNRVEIRSAKDYDISYGAWIESTNVVVGQYYIVQLMKNGVEIDSTAMQYSSIANQFMRLTGTATGVQAVSTDYFEVFIYSSANHSVNTLAARRVWLDVRANQAPTTISANEEMSLRYTSSSGQAITTSTTTYIYAVKDYDTHGLYNTSTGEFIPKTSGRFKIKAQILDTYNAATYDLYVRIYKNGTLVSSNVKTVVAGSGNLVSHEDTLDLISTDVITIKVDQSTGTGSAAISNQLNVLTIARVK